jgi:ribosomal protein L16 Arg81 hydroxylase
MITHIDEIAACDFNNELFDKQYFQMGKPLVVKGLFLEDDQYGRWTLDFLLDAVNGADRKIRMSVYERHEDRHVQFFKSSSTEEHDLPEALRLSFTDPELTGKCYNMLEAAVPELVSKVEIPDFLEDKTATSEGNVWIGNGNITGLHFDAPNNYYFQLKGQKFFYIFDPSHYFYLYPAGSNGSEFSDVENIDRQRFPLTSHLKPICVRLEPGDFLFLPSFWWHQVRSAGSYISINFWGYPRIQQCLCYPGFYEILKHFELGVLIQMFNRSSKYGIEEFTVREVIQMLLTRGYDWAAFIIGIALFQDLLNERMADAGISNSQGMADRTEQLYARMTNLELNFENIRFEHLAEDRFFESCHLLKDNDVISDKVFRRLYRYASLIRPAKLLDNVTISPGLVNEVMDLYEELVAEVELIPV